MALLKEQWHPLGTPRMTFQIQKARASRNPFPRKVFFSGVNSRLSSGNAIVSTFDHNAHASRRAGDDSRRMLLVAGIQVHEFLLGDVLHLLRGDLVALVLARALGLLRRVDDLAPLL